MEENSLKCCFHSIAGFPKYFLQKNVFPSARKNGQYGPSWVIFGRLNLRKNYVCKYPKIKKNSLKCCFHSIPRFPEHILAKNNVSLPLVKTPMLDQTGNFWQLIFAKKYVCKWLKVAQNSFS